MRFLDLSPNYSDILYILLRRHLFVNLGAIQLQLVHTSTIPAPQVLGSRNGGREVRCNLKFWKAANRSYKL